MYFTVLSFKNLDYLYCAVSKPTTTKIMTSALANVSKVTFPYRSPAAESVNFKLKPLLHGLHIDIVSLPIMIAVQWQ